MVYYGQIQGNQANIRQALNTKNTKIGRGKNLCGKTVKVDNPYEIYKGNGFEWRVLKKYQMPHMEKGPICMLGGIVPLRVR